MHQIAIAVPQLFNPGSSPGEKNAVNTAISKCLSSLKSLDKRVTAQKSGDNQVVFALPHVFHPSSDLGENAAALEPLLECMCDIDLAYFRYNPRVKRLYSQNAPIYDRTVVWDTTPALYKRGYGDCKSLACSRVAELRFAGLEARPVFRFLPPDLSKGQFQYHILVLGPNGFEDPSKVKGMGKDENAYFQAVS